MTKARDKHYAITVFVRNECIFVAMKKEDTPIPIYAEDDLTAFLDRIPIAQSCNIQLQTTALQKHSSDIQTLASQENSFLPGLLSQTNASVLSDCVIATER